MMYVSDYDCTGLSEQQKAYVLSKAFYDTVCRNTVVGSSVRSNALKAYENAEKDLVQWFLIEVRDFPMACDIGKMSRDEMMKSMEDEAFRKKVCKVAVFWKKDWKKKIKCLSDA